MLLVTDAFATERERHDWEKELPSRIRRSISESWDHAWIPAVPRDSDYARRLAASTAEERVAPPTDFRVLVQTGRGTQFSLKDLHRLDALEGTVVNVVESLHTGIDRILREAYPGADIGRCWILELDRKPEAPRAGWLKLLGGLALIGGGVGTFLWQRRLAARARQAEARRIRQKEERRQRRPSRGQASE